MNPILLYLLKVNLALLLCYAIYRLLFEKDTFFQLRRFLLLAFFGIALLYPLVDVQGCLEEKGTVQQVAVLYAAWLPEVTIRATSGGWSLTQVLNTACLALCIGGWTVLSLRFAARLAGIVRLIRQSPKMRVRGVEIRCLARPDSPFSFFRAIFIHPASHADSELDEILLHEETHARQIHSADVLIAMSNSFRARLKEGGALIMSGVINSRAAQVEEAMKSAGFTLEEKRTDKEWTGYLWR